MDMIRVFLMTSLVVAIVGCAKKSDNPLLDATDGQFKIAIGAYFDCVANMEKAAKVFSEATKVKGEEEQERSICLEKGQKLAVGAGISDNVTFDHILDPRVKERYVTLKAEPTK